MQPQTRPTEQAIAELKAQIDEANLFGSSAAGHSAQRLRSCANVGTRLLEWRSVIPRGEWEDFTTEHFPDLTKETRCRWMRLAHLDASGKLDLESARGLRHAYQLAQILPDSDASKPKSSTIVESWLVHLARLKRSLETMIIENLSARQRHEMADRLEIVPAFQKKLRTTTDHAG